MSNSRRITPVECRAETEWDRRHLAEELRKERIFNAKQRIIGVDREGLGKQLEEKRRLADQERATNRAFEANILAWDRKAVYNQKQQDELYRKLCQDIDVFRMTQQEPNTRREFDLYDPDRLKKDKPARVSDYDPNCSVSGIQRLDGEDLDYEKRRKEQQEQFYHWLLQQEEERRQRGCELKEQEDMYETNIILQDREAHRLMSAEQHDWRMYNTAVKEFNERMAEDQRQWSREKNLSEEEATLQHIRNCYYGDFLSENPETARSVFGPHRVIPDRWKGMSPEQLESIRKFQLIQAKERKSMEEEVAQNELDYGRRLLSQQRATLLEEREFQRLTKQHQRELLQENQLLAQKQNEVQRYLKDEVYTNRPTADYFNQFNTTSR